MSWRSGAQVFLNVFGVLQTEVKDEELRRSLAQDIISVFQNHDVEIEELEGIDPELDALLGVEE